MNALLICGSTRPGSRTRQLLLRLETYLKNREFATKLWDCGQKSLPIADPKWHRDPISHPSPLVRDLIESVSQANAIVLGTPLYHGSYSGVLKNALDHLQWDAFRDKWVGLLCNGGGIRGCALPCDHLRAVVGTLHGYSAQTQVCSAACDFSEQGTVLSEEIDCRLQRLATELHQCSFAEQATI